MADQIIPPQASGILDYYTSTGALHHLGRTFHEGLAVVREAAGVPRAALGGVRDAIQEMNDAADSLGDWLSQHVIDLGSAQVFDKEGNLDLKYFAPSTLSPEETGITLPNIRTPNTVTGEAVRSISQFITGFDGKPTDEATEAIQAFVQTFADERRYLVQADGICLPGIIENDEYAVIDPEARIVPLDVCAVVLDDYTLQMIKVFIGARTLPGGKKVWAFGQLNPGMIMVVPEERVNVIHKVAAVMTQDGLERPVAGIHPDCWLSFAVTGKAAVEPLEPHWRPV
jgi:hypothetical protein